MSTQAATMNWRRIQVTPIVLALAMISTALGVEWLQPQAQPLTDHQSLAQSIPAQFGDWKEVSGVADQIDPGKGTADEPNMDRPYDDVLMRTYQNSRGDVVLLALAYGRNQRQEVKIHRPDVCYTAQGFQLVKRSSMALPMSGTEGAPIQGMRMLVKAPGRVEAVSYWIRIGDLYSRSAWQTRTHIFTEGLHGRVVDGILVRVSQVVPDAASATTQRFALQEDFLAQLVHALPADARGLLIGGAR
jgi:EpsI family protein